MQEDPVQGIGNVWKNLPQIDNSIIIFIEIDMVNFFVRPYAVNKPPCQPMRVISFTSDTDAAVAVCIDVSGNGTQPRASAGLSDPSEMPSVRIIFENVSHLPNLLDMPPATDKGSPPAHSGGVVITD